MAVENFEMEGYKNPLTKTGTIIAEGVVVSCYTTSHHYLSDIAVWPLKKYSQLMYWMYGDAVNEESDYFHPYITWYLDLKGYLPFDFAKIIPNH